MENCDIRFKIIYVTIEETTIFNPTAVQALTCLRVCQMVSNSFLDIHLIRFNEIKGYVYILAGDEMEILIFPEGNWRFIDET
ncbi:MAG: hypothetical protein WCO49_10090 [Nostocales cyanobacterium ELA608]|jgi:hypothetical protein|uniref:DUF6888 domain-containing protein n=1 Tax=Aphanizomenon flos-aquae WA102 TaxID=1710896 RepID=A0A1B7X264_APHFL|nr:MAG: hypothetical protein AN488_09135 [Anabaena sp. WA113]OBQ43481.1 MAG: hypothetical protein AN484_12115 [Aphanizomenon flos-aquae WA102]